MCFLGFFYLLIIKLTSKTKFENRYRRSIEVRLTFDQSLFWKATKIVHDEPPASPLKKIVTMLGGFHTRMSFLGAIGYIMEGSGLKEMLELVYGENTVKHIFSGKAVARAVRAHELVDASLNISLLCLAYSIPYGERPSDHEDLVRVSSVYDDLVDGKISVEEAANHEALQTISLRLEALESSLKSSSTAKLVMQYSEMVPIVPKFLKAERTGDWDLYLSSLSDMLPYLAAAGHNLYGKSVRLFLQMMQELEASNPQLFEQFASDKFIARRSDRFWAGLAPDLVIERVLMRSLKTDGGLTRGKGMTELQRNIWTMSMPVLASVNDLMQKLTGLEYSSSEKHVTATAARIQRDTKDLLTFLEFLLENSPFTSSTEP